MNQEHFSDASPAHCVPVSLLRRAVSSRGVPELVPVPSCAFTPDPLPPKLDWRALKADLFDDLVGATSALSRINGLVPLTPNSGVLLHALWLREAKLSSEIENIHTTALDMVLSESRGAGDERNTAHEALNAMKAVRHGLESDLPFSGRLIKGMHHTLLVGVRGEETRPGEYRDVQAWIGPKDQPERARYVPPPPGSLPGQVDACMSDLERFTNAGQDEIPDLVRIALMHYQFEAIHPFRDGNGRIGRALILHQLCHRRLVDLPIVFVSGYFQEHRQEYVDRMHAVSADGEWVAWIRFFVRAVATQAAQTLVLAERLVRLHAQYSDRVQQSKGPVRLLTLVNELFKWPVVTARSVERLLGVTDPTARADISRLVDLGILQLTDDVSYGKAWYPPEILALIEATDLDEGT